VAGDMFMVAMPPKLSSDETALRVMPLPPSSLSGHTSEITQCLEKMQSRTHRLRYSNVTRITLWVHIFDTMLEKALMDFVYSRTPLTTGDTKINLRIDICNISPSCAQWLADRVSELVVSSPITIFALLPAQTCAVRRSRR